MSTDAVFTDPALEALRKRYFPRVPWTDRGPVRRRYLARAEGRTVAEALQALALEEGFIAPGGHAVTGDAAACLAAYRTGENGDTLVFGRGLDSVWCDLSLTEPDAGGWQEMIVRSETAENLIALASTVGAVRFKKV